MTSKIATRMINEMRDEQEAKRKREESTRRLAIMKREAEIRDRYISCGHKRQDAMIWAADEVRGTI